MNRSLFSIAAVCAALIVVFVAQTPCYKTTTTDKLAYIFGYDNGDYDVWYLNAEGKIRATRVTARGGVVLKEMPELQNVGYIKHTQTKLEFDENTAAFLPAFLVDEHLELTEIDVPVGTLPRHGEGWSAPVGFNY